VGGGGGGGPTRRDLKESNLVVRSLGILRKALGLQLGIQCDARTMGGPGNLTAKLPASTEVFHIGLYRERKP